MSGAIETFVIRIARITHPIFVLSMAFWTGLWGRIILSERDVFIQDIKFLPFVLAFPIFLVVGAYEWAKLGKQRLGHIASIAVFFASSFAVFLIV